MEIFRLEHLWKLYVFFWSTGISLSRRVFFCHVGMTFRRSYSVFICLIPLKYTGYIMWVLPAMMSQPALGCLKVCYDVDKHLFLCLPYMAIGWRLITSGVENGG
jgi:hypothetical protein